ncbi:hypothetical protein QR680_004496 [Steinernema hermaphroditum]|uniref:Uncharacterized protein n=1 Tax=Steinernema hermaphroditum TaxID=289476 RepID=A0AA39HR30_9BILA|nr:hypothetical protein QR680_004496 [Steinernema hermaphroditum]
MIVGMNENLCIANCTYRQRNYASRITMDAVPVTFIEKVETLLEWRQPFVNLSSGWRRVAEEHRLLKPALLMVYLVSNNEALFMVMSQGSHVALDRLHEIFFEDIVIKGEDPKEEHRHQCRPLDRTNFELLRTKLKKDDCGCFLELDFEEAQDHPYLEQLCASPSRIVEIAICKNLIVSRSLVARSVQMETLRSFKCFVDFNLTQDALDAFFRFLAFTQLEHFLLFRSANSPMSYDTLLTGAIDAFLSKERTEYFVFYVDETKQHLCERLTADEMREKVCVHFDFKTDFINIYEKRAEQMKMMRQIMSD